MAKKVICDTNILIEFFNKNIETNGILEEIGFENVYLCSVSIMELFFGASNKIELQRIKKAISPFNDLYISYEISYKAVELIEKYSKSHGLTIPDALIAATAICENVPLFTYDKDFKSIEGITLYKY